MENGVPGGKAGTGLRSWVGKPRDVGRCLCALQGLWNGRGCTAESPVSCPGSQAHEQSHPVSMNGFGVNRFGVQLQNTYSCWQKSAVALMPCCRWGKRGGKQL